MITTSPEISHIPPLIGIRSGELAGVVGMFFDHQFMRRIGRQVGSIAKQNVPIPGGPRLDNQPANGIAAAIGAHRVDPILVVLIQYIGLRLAVDDGFVGTGEGQSIGVVIFEPVRDLDPNVCQFAVEVAVVGVEAIVEPTIVPVVVDDDTHIRGESPGNHIGDLLHERGIDREVGDTGIDRGTVGGNVIPGTRHAQGLEPGSAYAVDQRLGRRCISPGGFEGVAQVETGLRHDLDCGSNQGQGQTCDGDNEALHLVQVFSYPDFYHLRFVGLS